MAHTPNSEHLDLSKLFTQYLERQIEAHTQGLGYPELPDEVLPHDAVPIQPVDPQLAWNDALAAVRVARPGVKLDAAVPPEWPLLVNRQEPAVALPFCLGNFPQMVRHLQPLLASEPAALRQVPREPLTIAGLEAWATQQTQPLSRLIAAAALRLAGHYEQAETLLEGDIDAECRQVRDNERAALAWHRGQTDKALTLWQDMPESPVVLFNRGAALLFLGNKELASVSLKAAVAALPEASAWHHLGRLYLTLCG